MSGRRRGDRLRRLCKGGGSRRDDPPEVGGGGRKVRDKVDVNGLASLGADGRLDFICGVLKNLKKLKKKGDRRGWNLN